jgi:uncharacterized protein YchJ
VKESLPIEPSIKPNISEDDNNKEEDIIEENSSFEREKNHWICIDSISSSQNRFLTLTITPDSLKHGRLVS